MPNHYFPLANWAGKVQRSALQEALLLTRRPNLISFALGLPDPQFFPTRAFLRAFSEALLSTPEWLQYGPPSGEMKSHVVEIMRMRGVQCKESQVFLTSGAQQALHLAVALLLDRGRQIITEEFTYPGFLQIAQFYEPETLTVTSDLGGGMDVEGVQWLLSRGAKPAFLYSIPDGHNPLGVTMSLSRRRKLVELAERFEAPIIEEDPYGLLGYGGDCPPPLRSFSEDWVLYVGSLSKVLSPSVRVGWIIAPEAVMTRLSILKESLDIDMATLSQHAAAKVLSTGCLPRHLEQLRIGYARKRDSLVAALRRQLPDCVCQPPRSGVYIWLRVPGMDSALQTLTRAVDEQRVAFMPGEAFALPGSTSARSCMRLNFSHPALENIDEGVARLARAIRGSTRDDAGTRPGDVAGKVPLPYLATENTSAANSASATFRSKHN